MAAYFDSVVVTCEHAGNRIPPAWRHLFRSAHARAALASHRGIDLGAQALARRLARKSGAPLLTTSVSRLLVETNRSEHHPALFSEFTRGLSDDQKHAILARHYTPHRQAVIAALAPGLAAGERVLHLAVHSFTPRLSGKVRRADIGLLYDPSRRAEAGLCNSWLRMLNTLGSGLVIRRNYPYRGVSDGLTTALRQRFGTGYLGIELEVNQKHLEPVAPTRARVHGALAASLARLAEQSG
jgi:predicted N-formylglutamate amidohydrolase